MRRAYRRPVRAEEIQPLFRLYEKAVPVRILNPVLKWLYAVCW